MPVAPGSAIAILGTGLAAAPVSATALPLPTTLGGVSVLVNGALAPLFYVSPGQISAQLPYETPPGPATLSVNGSASVSFTVASSAPGIMTGTASYGSVSRQATIEEQPLAEGDLFAGLRIVSRYHRASRAVGDANLSKGLGPGQRTRFGNGGCVRGGFLRRFVRPSFCRRTRLFARTLATENQRSWTNYQHKRDAHSCSLRNPHLTVLLCAQYNSSGPPIWAVTMIYGLQAVMNSTSNQSDDRSN